MQELAKLVSDPELSGSAALLVYANKQGPVHCRHLIKPRRTPKHCSQDSAVAGQCRSKLPEPSNNTSAICADQPSGFDW